MKWTALLLLLNSGIAVAQPGQPAKLMILSGGSVAVTDYPSMARCEAAKSVLLRIVQHENVSHPPQVLPGGGTIMTLPISIRAFCFPG